MVAIEIDPLQLRKLDRTFGYFNKNVPKVLSMSINRALNKGRTEVRREIRKEYVIKQKDIPIAVYGATPTHLGGKIELRDTMMDLNKFKVTPRSVQRWRGRRPIHAQVRVHGGGNISYAFMTRLRYPGPYKRVGPERLPIKKLLSISAPIMASQPKVGPVANKAMGDTLAKEIDRHIKRVMSSAGGHHL